MLDLGKWFIIIGCFIVFIGVLIWLFNKMGIPLGHLPGDISVSKENFSFYFPIVTTIILSIILTVIINIVIALFRR